MEDKRFVLALDQGTTSSRAILFDESGMAAATAQREFTQHYPQPGWVEHDPVEIWETQRETAAEVLTTAGVAPGAVAAIGITNQRETTVVWERATGEPLHPAIVWQDRRTSDFCKALKEQGHAALFTQKTGLKLDPYFSGTKVRWILDHVDGARRRAEEGELAFGTIDSWILWNLTGGRVHATDASNASRTLLYDIHGGEWDAELLEILRVPREMLPEVRSSSEIYGEVSDGVLPGWGTICVAGMAGDQQAALFGQGCFEPGMAKNTYGTGCFLLMNTGEKAVRSENELLTTVAWKIGKHTEYALEGSVFVAGAVIQWLRDELGVIASAAECDTLAESVQDNGGLYLVPAFTGLGAPHWDPYARGAAFGITRGTGKAHFARAALESIAFQTAELIACMQRDSGIELTELRVDGGACRSRPLLQFQADLLQVPVMRPSTIETTALGAAYLAGLAVGFWKGRADIARQWQLEATFEAAMDGAERARLQRGWEKALERSKGWAEE